MFHKFVLYYQSILGAQRTGDLQCLQICQASKLGWDVASPTVRRKIAARSRRRHYHRAPSPSWQKLYMSTRRAMAKYATFCGAQLQKGYFQVQNAQHMNSVRWSISAPSSSAKAPAFSQIVLDRKRQYLQLHQVLQVFELRIDAPAFTSMAGVRGKVGCCRGCAECAVSKIVVVE
jgi:hypothetical protein